MTLDDELAAMEEFGETEAEAIDQETSVEDYQGDLDEILGDEAEESDMERAYESFMTDNEADYDGFEGRRAGGWDDTGVDEDSADRALGREGDDLGAEGYSVDDADDLEAEVIEMEIEEGDIEAYIVDEDGNEIGFVLIEDGKEVEYYFVDDDEELDDADATVMRASDEKEFDLGLTRETIKEVTSDMNSIYQDSKEVVDELKEALDDISDSLHLKKKR